MRTIPTRALYDMLRGPSPAIHIAPDVDPEPIQALAPGTTVVVTPSLEPGTIRDYRFIPKG